MHRVFEGNHRRGFSLRERPRGWDETLAITGYQHMWSAQFETEALVLRESLRPLVPQLEHVGSTAVPGLVARPIIDIALALPRPVLIGTYVERLRNFGYLPEEGKHNGCSTFVRRERGVRTHDVIVVAAGSPAWHALLDFRDRLRAEPALAAEYGWMKERLAPRPPTLLSAYREAKAAFVRRVLRPDEERPAA